MEVEQVREALYTFAGVLYNPAQNQVINHSKVIEISPSSPWPKSWSAQALGSRAIAPSALAPTLVGIVTDDRKAGLVGHKS